MQNGSSKFFRQIGLNAKIHGYRNLKSLLHPIGSCPEHAISLCPNWKRELTCLAINRARNKHCFKMPRAPYTSFNNFHKIDSAHKVHDLDNSSKIFEILKGTLSNELINFRHTGTPERVICLHPTASTQFKFYSLRFWKDLIDLLVSQDYQLKIFCGTNNYEIDFCRQLLSDERSRDRISLYIGANFKEIADIFSRSEIFIGLDSSLGHLASFYSPRTISLWSFADYSRIAPYGSEVYIPHEVLNKYSHEYPKKKLSFLDRASACDILQIIEKNKSPVREIGNKLSRNTLIFSY